MTRAELFEVVYRFYPRGKVDIREYEGQELSRQTEAIDRGIAEYPTWKAMICRLGELYQIMDHSVWLLEGWSDPGCTGQIWIPGHTLYFHVSFLGPYYAINRTDTPDKDPAELDLTGEIEATYRGYERVPLELCNEVVPDLDAGQFGRTTLYHRLFLGFWEFGSGPRPMLPPPSPEERVALHAIARARGARSYLTCTAEPVLEPREPLDGPSGEDDEPGRRR